MKHLKWNVIPSGSVKVFLKTFPILGTMAKLHRPVKLPPSATFNHFLRENRVRQLVLEPDKSLPQARVNAWIRKLPSDIKLNRSPYLPTKTIRIDLTKPAEKIFGSFSEAKRRAVRRASKLGVTVKKSDNIGELIRVKNASGGLLGFITTTGIRELYEIFAPDHAAILLAYDSKNIRVIGGVLLLLWDRVAYYWIAGATKYGKKLFSPTLLVWEAVKFAKTAGARQFDFVGVWDERLPRENTSWKGFTKFKEGFGGKTVYYPLARVVSSTLRK